MRINWNIHINNIKLRLSKGISILAKIRHYVPKTVLRSLYFTFVNSHIDYNLINWGTGPPAYTDSIGSKIRKAIRIINFKDKDEPPIGLFKKMSILPLDESLELRQASFMWKLKNNLLPPSLASNFRTNRNQVVLIHNRLQSSSKHITYAGPTIWLDLPENIQNKTSLKSFTKSFKEYLLSNL